MARGALPQRLAIGVDAAEGSLVRELIRNGELPVLASLLGTGTWLDVESPPVGSGAVWPTFFTGTEPEAHGTYGNWAWRPDEMRIVPTTVHGLRPFWLGIERAGHTVGVLDVPFAPHAGVNQGFEVTEWGPHDVLIGRLQASPAWVGDEVRTRHPFRNDRTPPQTADEPALSALGRTCIEGARLRGDVATRLLSRARPDVALIVFSEVHHAAHRLWHILAPDHPAYAGLPSPHRVSDLLRQLYGAIDVQIGRLLATVPADTPVAVFSLHGMRPARGIVTLLQPILEALGFAAASSQVPSGRQMLAEVKRLAPASLKRAYYRLAPRTLTYRVAGEGIMPTLDWDRTRAFALPSDQNGWVRVNLRDRERNGIVARADYDITRQELATALTELRSPAGEPLVGDVIAPSGPTQHVPDLIVHWSDAASRASARVAGLDLDVEAEAPTVTGQHTLAGFCIANALGESSGPRVRNADLARLLFGSP
jgi:predicted AlkP superfamily phosphohydrolase/phosphomutase